MKKKTKQENEKGMEANEALKETSKLEKKLEEVIKCLEDHSKGTWLGDHGSTEPREGCT